MNTENNPSNPENRDGEKLLRPQVRCAPGIYLTPEQTALMSNAFPGEKVILVKEEFRSGYSGAVVVLVTIGAGRAPLVIKFAHPIELQREYDAYVEFVRQVSPQNVAHLQGEPIVSEDEQLGMIQYTFAGGESHLPTNSLGAYYDSEGAEDTAAVLNRIFRVYGRHWWANNHAESYVLDEYYDRLLPVHLQAKPIDAEIETDHTIRMGESSAMVAGEAKIGETILLVNLVVAKSRDDGRRLTLRSDPPESEATAALRIRVEGEEPTDYRPGDVVESMIVEITATRMSLLGDAARATLHGFDPQAKQFTVPAGYGEEPGATSGIVLPNPLVKLPNQLYSVVETKMSVIHGDLNLQNVLVDMPTGFSWLIDFAETRVGPTLLDLQRLEVQVVTKLMAEGGTVPLASVVEMMTRLHADPPLPAPPQPQLAEPYTLLVAIRRLARQYLIDDLDWNEYYYGLVVALLGALKYDELEDFSRQLAFVCAAAADSLIGKPLQNTSDATETQLIVTADSLDTKDSPAPPPVTPQKVAPAEATPDAAQSAPAKKAPVAPPVARQAASKAAAPKPVPAGATEPAPATSPRNRTAGIAIGAVALLLVALAVVWFATRSTGTDDTATGDEGQAAVAAAPENVTEEPSAESAVSDTGAGDQSTDSDGGDTSGAGGDSATADGAAAAAAEPSETPTPVATSETEAETDSTTAATPTDQPAREATGDATDEGTPSPSGTPASAEEEETPSATSSAADTTPTTSATGSTPSNSTSVAAGAGTPDANEASLEPVFTLNVRSGPGTAYDVVGSLEAGTVAAVMARASMDDGEWYQIEYPLNSGDLAWITGNPSLVQATGEEDMPVIDSGDLPTPPPPPPTRPAPARATSGQGTIYYSATADRGIDNIYRVSAAGGTPIRVEERGRQPSVSADGTQLAFQNLNSSSLGVSSIDLSSYRSTRFSSAPEDGLPSWSPSGNALVYASNREGDRAFRLYATSGGGNELQLGRGTEPDWHPSRDEIVYRGCNDAGARCGLWTMASTGSNRQQLTDDASDSRPNWSPDGRSVVFMSRNRDGNWEIYSVDVASGDVTRLTDNPANDGLPVYSPDGGSIAFLSNRGAGGAWEIQSMDTGGENLQRVVRLDGNLPDWLAQGLDWAQ